MWPFTQSAKTRPPEAVARGPASPRDLGAPGRSLGLVARLRQAVGNWLGPRLSHGTPVGDDVVDEKMAAGPRGVVMPQFAPYIQNPTLETAAMRVAYRQMFASPEVKSAVLGKILSVANRDLRFQPSKRRDPEARRHADFCDYTFNERLSGVVPQLAWSILSGAIIDGYSVSEKVWAYEDRGQWSGQYVLRDLKPKDVGYDLVLQTDAFLNVVGVMGLRYNGGLVFSPANFLIFRHLPLFGQATGMSDLRAVYARWWMLDTVQKLRLLALEKRALPLLVGHYGNDTVRGRLETALGLAKHSWWLAVPEAVRLEALDIAGRGDEMFRSAVQDLKHDVFLGIRSAVLQNLEGTTTDARGNSQVHQSESETIDSFLAKCLAAAFNDRDTGLIKDVIDLNFVASAYPKATIGSIDVNELAQQVAIDNALHSWGMPLSKDDTYERYQRTPPHDDEDNLPGQQAPQPGGPPGGGVMPFLEGATVNALTAQPKRLDEPPGVAARPFRGFSERWAEYLAG